MYIDSIQYLGYHCFKDSLSELKYIKPINVIIGRNNSGKSYYLRFIELLCIRNTVPNVDCICSGVLDERTLKDRFPENTYGGPLTSEHWSNYGRHFVGKRIFWDIRRDGTVANINLDTLPLNRYGHEQYIEIKNIIENIARHSKHFLSGTNFRWLLADRDIRPEIDANDPQLLPDGTGATSIINRYVNTIGFRRELIQQDLLFALDDIFGKDGRFIEITARKHALASPINPPGSWEIILGEQGKELYSLSESGSGLKTIILVLLNLLVIPEMEKKEKSSYVFAFEELENNLHPALFRRLLEYLEEYVTREKAIIFLTTHSSVALDFFGTSNSAQIIRVTHDGKSAVARSISTHFDKLDLLAELGTRPSDLLQANGIIWVEGPSDRIYLNKWIELFSDGSLHEGRDYQCAFTGGSLIGRDQFASPDDQNADWANLLNLNRNFIVICDSDRTNETDSLKPRVQRIKDEVDKIPGSFIWITQGKEIENYLTGSVLAEVFKQDLSPEQELVEIEQYQPLFPKKKKDGLSYLEKNPGITNFEKIDLAIQATRIMTEKEQCSRFDLVEKMERVIATIGKWNGK
ncbi:MAG: hypothetical protein CVU59_00175 [Deltaproteobacteria bacterium HGW-Deltaproteobacteria-17]|nr:MAG: hypothetical protein CVU59_00175 [Deltaproteobacteria bacterium HGW-Deltaproteobacteria-17]